MLASPHPILEMCPRLSQDTFSHHSKAIQPRQQRGGVGTSPESEEFWLIENASACFMVEEWVENPSLPVGKDFETTIIPDSNHKTVSPDHEAGASTPCITQVTAVKQCRELPVGCLHCVCARVCFEFLSKQTIFVSNRQDKKKKKNYLICPKLFLQRFTSHIAQEIRS